MMAGPYRRKAVLLAVQRVRFQRPTPPSFAGTPSQAVLPASNLRSASHFSTATDAPSDETTSKPHPQSFVDPNIELTTGELSDLPPNFHQHLSAGPLPSSFARHSRHAKDGKDAYWRPPWKSRAEIISAEDFANRPRVTFSESFESLQDGMITLSWLTDNDATLMYQLYVNLMTAFVAKNEGVRGKDGSAVKDAEWGVLSANTSHEYVVRVVAQKFNVTTSRAAGVIQLKHNEEQLKKDPNFKVDHKLQAHVDNMIRQQISEVYRSYGEKDPLGFVEDPIVSTGIIGHEDVGSPAVTRASDLLDIDALVERKKKEEKQEAITKMRNHIYVEDVDDKSVNVKIDKEARRLLKSSEKLKSLYSSEVGNTADSSDKSKDDDITVLPESNKPRTKVPIIPEYASPYPENNAGHKSQAKTRRPRWKYAAQIINTYALENPPHSSHHGKKAAARIKAKRHGRVVDGNTLIEQDGKVRVATVAELEQTSWKHVRNESEFMFKGVKEAWLRRQLEGEVGGWGLQEEVNAPEPVEETKEVDAEGGELSNEDAS
ncbi:hypothetical protein HJC23_009787 [Cyclotella cryptica]|uniref:Uncharacterized protein n=1 Tax=Cyclotella cryptica TaxID=29204 RepID=A0ABD3PSF6_9STRA|eukprot:CCRYP_012155-RA/>CCRYP_012155-RA protein AED:0.32 eAED:0.32 QI:0/-1/0/1/-1/1/1/0/543